ncbi:sigma-70 family RNA polymerase sigma factor [Candidatus Amoebophilus asiaticus]|nr:sigma-70 family RNA polymerase sigma factor [Candidatus Amoebophilus asiaticus]
MASPDSEILAKFKNPDTRNYAFNLLVQKYQKRLYWHVRRMVIDHDDADDVVQNVFIKVFKSLDKFKEESKLYTWLYKIATNESITFINKKRTRFFIPMEDVEHQLSESLEDDNYYSGDEVQMKLQKALLSLPEKQRLVFNMKYYDDLKYKEMSEILGTSVGALKASFHHAVKKIEKYLSED